MLPRTKVFVGSLPPGTKPEELRSLFEKFGNVTECDIMNRCGFVHMQTQEMADSAIQALNQTTFRGTTISVERGRMKDKNQPGQKKGPGGNMRNNPMQRGGPMMGRGPPMGGGMRGPPGGMNKGNMRGGPGGMGGGGGNMGGGGPMRRGGDRMMGGPGNRPNPYQRNQPDFGPGGGGPNGMRNKPNGMRNNGMEPFRFDDMMPPMEMNRGGGGGGMMDRGTLMSQLMSQVQALHELSNQGMDRGPMGGNGGGSGPDRFDDDDFGFSNEDRRGFALPERNQFDRDGPPPMFDDRRGGPPPFMDDMRRGGPPMRGGADVDEAQFVLNDFMGRNSGGMGGGDMFTRRPQQSQMRGGPGDRRNGGPPGNNRGGRGGSGGNRMGGGPGGNRGNAGNRGGGFDRGDSYNQAFPPLGAGGGPGMRNGPPRRW
ncbi:hypothetical protein DMENIID0001_094240 [Sergentomyia squamirostris]